MNFKLKIFCLLLCAFWSVTSNAQKLPATTLTFQETFDNNEKAWDLYSSNESLSEIKDGQLIIKSISTKGTSRYIEVDHPFEEYSIEGTVIKNNTTKKNIAGIIFGFEDWDNFWYFTIQEFTFSIGYYYQGIHSPLAANHYASEINSTGENVLKLITSGEYIIFSINKNIQFKTKRKPLFGKKAGFIVSSKSQSIFFDNLIVKEFESTNESGFATGGNTVVKSTGTGFLVSNNGYIVTNYHVIEKKGIIEVDVYNDGNTKSYPAKIIREDRDNDLALLKIETSDSLPKVEYAFRSGTPDVGSFAYTIGYPLVLSGLGKEPKFTDGKVSSKSGYKNAINTFQTNIAVQPGNSGGPVFNNKGELVGVINAKIFEADNVSYAIKSSYLIAMLESLDDAPAMNNLSNFSNADLETQIKAFTKSVVLIKLK